MKARRKTARLAMAVIAAVFAIAASSQRWMSYAEAATLQVNASTAMSASGARLPASLPLIRETDTPLAGGGARLVAFLALAALACAGTVVVRRRRGQSGKRRIRSFGWAGSNSGKSAHVVQSLRLTPKASAHVLQWHGREWLIACTDQALTVLGHDPCEPEGAAGQHGSEAP